MSAVIASVAAGYLAVAIMFQSAPRRTSVDMILRDPDRGLIARRIAWVFLLVSLILLAPVQGWERGIPAWLATLTAVGIANLLLGVFAPKAHRASLVVALAIAVASFAIGFLS